MTARSGMRSEPDAVGARTVKANVAIPPGGTTASDCAAGRSGESQFTFMPSAENERLSPLMPRFACEPMTPLVQVAVPLLRKRTCSCVASPGARVGHGDWSMKLEWYEADGAGGGGFVPLPAVVKSHSFVVIAAFTLMSNRT